MAFQSQGSTLRGPVAVASGSALYKGLGNGPSSSSAPFHSYVTGRRDSQTAKGQPQTLVSLQVFRSPAKYLQTTADSRLGASGVPSQAYRPVGRPGQAPLSICFWLTFTVNCSASARPCVVRSGSALTQPLQLTYHGSFLQGSTTRRTSQKSNHILPSPKAPLCTSCPAPKSPVTGPGRPPGLGPGPHSRDRQRFQAATSEAPPSHMRPPH